MIRWQGLLDHLCQKPVSWESRYTVYKNFNPSDHLKNQHIPSHIRLSFPKSFFQFIVEHYGEEKAFEICLSSNTEAPITLRINSLKTNRDILLEQWKNLYQISPCLHSSLGIMFHKRTNFFAMPEFKEGLFEVQDEGSQLIAGLVEAKPGQQVLDFCAGSGGKTLAFAPQMQGGGQIYLHDIRPRILQEAKKRLYRAGIQNAQVLFYDDPKKNALKGRMDWVLVDAPCSGSGTLRRNPDMKWKFNKAMVDRLVQEQRAIFEEALEFLRPNGRIVYATCSIFPEENEHQAAFFKENFNVKALNIPFQSLPCKGGMDGFFGTVFSRV
jgi:16S rRNA (cytosine967-C5)-methyltransferase